MQRNMTRQINAKEYVTGDRERERESVRATPCGKQGKAQTNGYTELSLTNVHYATSIKKTLAHSSDLSIRWSNK